MVSQKNSSDATQVSVSRHVDTDEVSKESLTVIEAMQYWNKGIPTSFKWKSLLIQRLVLIHKVVQIYSYPNTKCSQVITVMSKWQGYQFTRFPHLHGDGNESVTQNLPCTTVVEWRSFWYQQQATKTSASTLEGISWMMANFGKLATI